MPLVANQLEFNVLHTPLIDMGVITNQSNPPSVVRGDWTMEYCRLHEITIQAWSPLARGAIGGKPLAGAEARAAKTAEIVADMARDHKASVEAVLIAWILKHPAKIQAIIGTMNPERVKACCQADTLELSREEWWRLWIAGRGAELP